MPLSPLKSGTKEAGEIVNKQEGSSERSNIISPKTRTIIFCVQIILVLSLLIIWFSSESIQQSKSLWVYVFYIFPANFLIAVVPFDPAILFFGKFHHPLTVTFLGISGVLLAEALNYSVFKYITDTKTFQKVKYNKFIQRLIELFRKAPFPALLIAAFLPIPFYPFRFLAVMSRYPLTKFLIPIFLAKVPRFYLIAFFGYKLAVSDRLFTLVIIIFSISLYFPFIRNAIRKKLNSKGQRCKNK